MSAQVSRAAPPVRGANNSAFRANGDLRSEYLGRMARVIERADALGAVIILSLYYQRQDQRLRDEQAVRAGVVNAVDWVRGKGYRNVILEIANEYYPFEFEGRRDDPVVYDRYGTLTQ